jgi:hypothetical protein
MKKIIVSYFILFLACQDRPEDASSRNVAITTFYQNVGQKISTELGLRWIENYQRQMSLSRDGQLFKVSQAHLLSMLTSEIIAMAFHYAIDDAGNTHILVVPLDGGMNLWDELKPKVIIDASVNSPITIADAKRWAVNYNNLHPNDIQYHLFGTRVFDEIVKSPEFEISPAVDDEQTPQLLLIVRHENTTGRIRSENTDVYDRSQRCPPTCDAK